MDMQAIRVMQLHAEIMLCCMHACMHAVTAGDID
jgi:hypothetical protein